MTNNPQQIRGRNGMLLLPPLLITLVFCYTFVLIQPQTKRSSRTLVASSTTPDSVANNDSLPALTLAPQTSLPTLAGNVQVSNATAPNSSGPVAQPSTAGAMSLQAAAASNGHNLVIKVNRSPAAKASNKTFRTSHRSTTFLNSLQTKQ